MNKPKRWTGPVADTDLFEMLRDMHDTDESCWQAVREAQKIYYSFKRQVSHIIDDDILDLFQEEAA